MILWPILLLASIPFLVGLYRSFAFEHRTIKIKDRKKFRFHLFYAIIFATPAILYASDVQLRRYGEDLIITSPDDQYDLVLSSFYTTRSIDLVDPSCRVIAKVFDRKTEEKLSRKEFFLYEADDLTNPTVKWEDHVVMIMVTEWDGWWHIELNR